MKFLPATSLCASAGRSDIENADVFAFSVLEDFRPTTQCLALERAAAAYSWLDECREFSEEHPANTPRAFHSADNDGRCGGRRCSHGVVVRLVRAAGPVL